jgi:hypothetical protein
MLAILWCDDEADADERDFRFRIDGPMEYSYGFSVGIAGRVVASGILKLNGDSPLQHQEKASAIV